MESSADPTLMQFIKSKGAEGVHQEFVDRIKTKVKAMMGNAMAGYYASSKIKPMLKDEFIAKYEAKGIKAVISKVMVVTPYREFLWVELIDTSAAGGYVASRAMP
jgi:hypothetical protein